MTSCSRPKRAESGRCLREDLAHQNPCISNTFSYERPRHGASNSVRLCHVKRGAFSAAKAGRSCRPACASRLPSLSLSAALCSLDAAAVPRRTGRQARANALENHPHVALRFQSLADHPFAPYAFLVRPVVPMRIIWVRFVIPEDNNLIRVLPPVEVQLRMRIRDGFGSK